MYKEDFYITENVWNNSLSFNNREDPKLFVPKLIKIDNFEKIKLLKKNPEKITFQDFWFDCKLSTNFWLENFYEIEYLWKKIYLFDNHNHALFFWYLSKKQWIIEKSSTLYHVDEHADYRDPQINLEKTDLKSIFKYTNFSDINVGNYIIPAEREWLIWETIQIRNTKNLEDYLNSPIIPFHKGDEQRNNIILNLDLDFFQPDLDFINYNLKKKVILDIAKKADVITVSTSPFFIDQKLALKVFKDLFKKDIL